MTPERRSAVAIGVAVFISGAVLLGLEIAASRVLAPYFGNSLFVWGALIGVVLAGLAIGYWVGGALADRLPDAVAARRRARRSARCSCSRSRSSTAGARAGRRLGPGPASEPAARLDRPLRRAERRARRGVADRRAAARRARSSDLGRTAGRLFSVSTVGSIVGTFVTAFWLVPELGTDQVLAVGRRRAAARRRGVVASPSGSRRGRARARARAARASAPSSRSRRRRAATVSAAQLRELVAGLPPRGDRRADRRSTDAQSGYDVLLREGHAATTGSRSSRTTTAATCASTARSRAGCTSTTRSGRASRTPTTSSSRSRTSRDAQRMLFIGLGGGSAPKRIWRDFPALELDVVELDPEVVDVAYELLRAAARPAPAGRGRGRPPLPRSATTGRWDVIVDRRVLLRLDPVPPGDAGVPRARAVAARARRRRRHEHHRRRPRRRLAPVPLDAPDVPRGLPDGASIPVVDAGDRDLTAIRNMILVAGDGAAPSKEFLPGALGRVRAAARRARPT